MENNIPEFLLGHSNHITHKSKRVSSYSDKAIKSISKLIKTIYLQWDSASKEALLQNIDARFKIVLLIFYLVVINVTREFIPLAGLLCILIIAMPITKLRIIEYVKYVFLPWMVFGVIIALPAALSVITPGTIFLKLLTLQQDTTIWIYHIPQVIGITREGAGISLLLSMRVLASLTVSFLILHTTTFQDIVKALRIFRVPDTVLMIITLAFKFIFLFAKTVEGFYVARKSRLAEAYIKSEQQWAAGKLAYMFTVTQKRYNDIYYAMNARGYWNSPHMHILHGFERSKAMDWFLTSALAIPAIYLIIRLF